MGLTELWTLIAVVLHLCNIGKFAEWPILDNPFKWSCCCIELWVLIAYSVLFIVIWIVAIYTNIKRR